LKASRIGGDNERLNFSLSESLLVTLLDCWRSKQYLLRDWSYAMIPLGGSTPTVESMVERWGEPSSAWWSAMA